MLKIILLGWIAGIAFIGRELPFIQSTWGIYSCIAVLLSGFCFYQYRKHQQSAFYKSIMLGSALSTCFCLGYHYADQALGQRLQLRETQVQDFEAVIYIKQLNELSGDKTKQVAEVLNRHSQVVQWLLSIKNDPDQPDRELQLGHYYRVSGKIRPAHSYAVAGAFDQEKWFIQQNLMATFTVKAIQLLTDDEIYALGYQGYLKQQTGLIAKSKLGIEQLRLNFRQMLQKSSLQHKGLLLGLLTGDESLLSEQLKQQFQRLGISHLLAISGPHVLVFAAMLTWALQQLIQRLRPQWYLWQPRQILMLLPFVLSVLLYVAFVGFEIPALRTLLTVLIGSLFILLRQSIRPLALLVYSASILLFFDPFSILSAAFWLSYGACFILLRIYQTIQQLPQNQPHTVIQKLLFAGKILVESQWKIFIALMPLVFIFFQQIAWIAPITNLIAIPFLGGVVVPLDIFSALVWLLIPSLGNLLFQLNDLFLSLLMFTLNGLEKISPALYGVSATPVMLFCFILAVIILFLPRGIVPKIWSAVCLLPFFLGLKAQPIILNILDVGQGSAALLQHPQHTLLVDTGGSYDETKFSIGERVVIPFLRQQGIRQLDHVILSHLDQDHSGAFPAIQNAFAMTQVQSSEKDNKLPFKDNFSYCYQGQTWQYPQLKVSILSPSQDELIYAKDNPNEHSCVVYLQFENAQPYQNFLIMGDAGWEAEYKLLQHYPDLKVDVLVLGHHGSKHSSAYDFLAQLKPKLAIASAGFNNRYGHPSLELQNRLQALNIPLLITPKTGTIRFIFENGQVEVRQYRQQWKWLERK